MSAPSPVAVEARDGLTIWLEYDNGESGIVDFSDLAGRGLCAAWEDRAVFEGVRVTPYGSIQWSDDLEMCGDALYLKMTGKTVEEVMPGFARLTTSA